MEKSRSKYYDPVLVNLAKDTPLAGHAHNRFAATLANPEVHKFT